MARSGSTYCLTILSIAPEGCTDLRIHVCRSDRNGGNITMSSNKNTAVFRRAAMVQLTDSDFDKELKGVTRRIESANLSAHERH